MLGEFDEVMQEHLRHIQSNQLQYHYNSHKIQTELIHMLANEVKTAIVQKIKKGKYFSLIFGCAIDNNFQEQMYLLIRCVDVTEIPVKIEEFFLGFIKVDVATRMSRFSELENILSDLGLNIDDIRGQGYDNGASTKVCKEDVQRRLLNVNPRAFCTPCGCHSLNIALCDLSNSSRKAISYFSAVHFLYTLFSSSKKGLDILKRHVTGLTLELFYQTRWESHIEYVKPISYYSLQIRDALDDLAYETVDPMTCSKAGSLADHEFGSFEFLVSSVIWYKVLYAVSTLSMTFQSEDMHVGVAIDQLRRVIAHFREYREHGFNDALTEAQELARQMDVEPVFQKEKEIFRKKPFDEDPSEETMFSPQESFRLVYFMHIVDGALASLDERLEQCCVYERNFGFLYDLKKCTDDECLSYSCQNLSNSLAHNGNIDFKGEDLFRELQFLKHDIPSEVERPIQVLNYLRERHGCFPNAEIAYRILLTIPITTASYEGSFSKLELIKKYLQRKVPQECLNELGMISIEMDTTKNIDYQTMITDFAFECGRSGV